jgi:AcrR family transcriptional regulator
VPPLQDSRRHFSREPDKKRSAILAAARQRFSESGYTAATTADIARQAGVSEGTVFHHFHSKQELLRAAAGEYGSELMALVLAMREAAPNPLERTLASVVEFVHDRGSFGLVLLRDTRVPVAVRSEIRDGIIAIIRGWITNSAGKGTVRDLDPQIGAEYVFAVLETMLESVFGAGSAHADTYLREAAYAIRGMLAPEPRDVRLSVLYGPGVPESS